MSQGGVRHYLHHQILAVLSWKISELPRPLSPQMFAGTNRTLLSHLFVKFSWRSHEITLEPISPAHGAGDKLNRDPQHPALP